eukprot:m.163592 g.163592  ORF g.163592 m.163592 type:complete len:372 (-) comp18104_c0_seq4:240-1355(-)
MADDNPRIKNLAGLLRWSAQHESGSTQAHGGETTENEDAERHRVLAEILQQMSVSTVDQMQQICGILQKEDMGQPRLLDEKAEALDALHDLIEDIDNASDFVKIGGVGVCYAALSSTCADIRERALSCIAAAAQNNPTVQAHMHKTNVLDKLFAILNDMDQSAEMLTRATQALSCVVRGLGGGENPIAIAFYSRGGLKVLARLLAVDGAQVSNRLLVKVAYMIAALAGDNMPSNALAQSQDILLGRLTTLLISADDNMLWEQVLKALVGQRCRAFDLHLRALLCIFLCLRCHCRMSLCSTSNNVHISQYLIRTLLIVVNTALFTWLVFVDATHVYLAQFVHGIVDDHDGSVRGHDFEKLPEQAGRAHLHCV